MNIFQGSCGYKTNIKAPYFIAAAQTMGGAWLRMCITEGALS